MERLTVRGTAESPEHIWNVSYVACETPAGKTRPAGPAVEQPPFAVAVELAVQLLAPMIPRKNGVQLRLEETLTPAVPAGIVPTGSTADKSVRRAAGVM